MSVSENIYIAYRCCGGEEPNHDFMCPENQDNIAFLKENPTQRLIFSSYWFGDDDDEDDEPATPQRERKKIPIEIREAVLSLGECSFCGATENLSVDHIHPHSRGGCDNVTNLQCLCRSCNSRKGTK